MSQAMATQEELDQQLKLALTFFKKIPFNQHLGLKPTLLTAERCEFKMSMKDELVGNFVTGILHGGAITTALDVTGGAMAFIANWERLNKKGVPLQDRLSMMSKMGTIDMRMDFLCPGKGKEFIASATLLRAGNKIAVTRMDFHNEEGLHIATATGTFLCG